MLIKITESELYLHGHPHTLIKIPLLNWLLCVVEGNMQIFQFVHVFKGNSFGIMEKFISNCSGISYTLSNKRHRIPNVTYPFYFWLMRYLVFPGDNESSG